MNPRFKAFFTRWIYFVLLFLLIATFGVIFSELIVGPLFQWLLFDIGYTFPSWDRVCRLTLLVLFIGFFAGTVVWSYEKFKSSR